jgi:hypothetical protein
MAKEIGFSCVEQPKGFLKRNEALSRWEME